MKDRTITIKLIMLLSILILFYICKDSSLFLYVMTLSLYNIYLSCFSHITLKETFDKNNCQNNKYKILKYISINITVICILFILLSILISDTISISLNIKNTFWPYLIMSLSVGTEPIIRIFLEYLESLGKPKLSHILLNMYYILEYILLLIISILTIKLKLLPLHIAISTLYLSKIFSFIIVFILIILFLKKIKINKNKQEQSKVNCRKEVKTILTNNTQISIIKVVKNSYYYISIILLYLVLSTRYSYNIELIEKDLTFVYLYGIYIINFITNEILFFNQNSNKKDNIINYIYIIFQKTLTISIIFSVLSPLICKIIFDTEEYYIYLMSLSFLIIFISLFNVTFEYIKNKKVIYISLISGIISKLILTIPLINALYRIGYNLIYGDIISTIISMSISIVINYIYIKTKNPKEKTLEKILTTLYENILLCIILVLLQFIIPINNDNYLKSLILLTIYIFISIIFIKIKKKKRG